MRRPSTRPRTAVTNSAVDSSCTQRISQAAGTTVRYGQDGEPDDEPGNEPEGDEGARVGALAEDAAAAHDEREADEKAQGGAEETDDADHGPRA